MRIVATDGARLGSGDTTPPSRGKRSRRISAPEVRDHVRGLRAIVVSARIMHDAEEWCALDEQLELAIYRIGLLGDLVGLKDLPLRQDAR